MLSAMFVSWGPYGVYMYVRMYRGGNKVFNMPGQDVQTSWTFLKFGWTSSVDPVCVCTSSYSYIFILKKVLPGHNVRPK